VFLELGKGQLGDRVNALLKFNTKNTKKDVKFKPCGGLLLYAPQVCVI